MIDSHVHVTASSADLRKPAFMTPSLLYARSVPILEEMLMRGFTTVRDCGGADHGLAAATEEERGPRIIYCGKALSQTGGHGDFRAAAENRLLGSCRCCNFTIGRGDGAACREAARRGQERVLARQGDGLRGGVPDGQVGEPAIFRGRAEYRRRGEQRQNILRRPRTPTKPRRAVRCGVRSIEHRTLQGQTLR